MPDDTRPSDNPTNLFEWLWRLKRYEHGIFVRPKVGGKCRIVALAELDARSWATYVAHWLEDGTLPVRVREPEEIQQEDE